MKVKYKYAVIGLLLLTFIAGCVSLAMQKMELREDLILSEYDTIRKIVIEEAANNGFPTLKSEVRPLEVNKWKGELKFLESTAAGWDNLTVKIKRKGDKFEVDMGGAATVANVKGAVKAIETRLSEL